jgi:competence protein ComEC
MNIPFDQNRCRKASTRPGRSAAVDLRVVALLAIVLLAAGAGWYWRHREIPTVWTMINVTPNEYQADCHLLEFPDGSNVLIDAADGTDAPGAAQAFLKKRGIKHLSLVVISHFHMDHYGRLADLVESGVKIDRVAINLPASRAIADREKPWGCDWDHVQSVLHLLRDRHVPYFTPENGEKLVDLSIGGVVIRLEVVCRYDGVNTPIGMTDVNDTSIILRLSHGNTRVLFTGDLNRPLGTYLATADFDFKADLLKVPHHGTEGAAPNEFFDRVQAKAALVSAPRSLWFSARSKRIRSYFEDHGTPTYVTGIHGNVTVILSSKRFTVRPEREL